MTCLLTAYSTFTDELRLALLLTDQLQSTLADCLLA